MRDFNVSLMLYILKTYLIILLLMLSNTYCVLRSSILYSPSSTDA